jgi:hypothetical protein
MQNVHWFKHASKSLIRLKIFHFSLLFCIAEDNLDISEIESALTRILHFCINIRLTIFRYLLGIAISLSTYMEYSPTSQCNGLLQISS